jgi:hypothetical protein
LQSKQYRVTEDAPKSRLRPMRAYPERDPGFGLTAVQP